MASGRAGDVVAGAVLAGLAVVVAWQSTSWPVPADAAGSPTIMPRLVAVLLAVVGATLILGRRPPPPPPEGGIPRLSHAVAGIAITALFAVALEPLGVVPAGILYLAALQRLVGATWRMIVPFAIGIPVLIWLVFVVGLHVPLPAGRLLGALGPG